jgi:hypothetical protein
VHLTCGMFFFSVNLSIISKQIPSILLNMKLIQLDYGYYNYLKKSITRRKKITTNQYIKEHIDILFVYMDNPELYKGPII